MGPAVRSEVAAYASVVEFLVLGPVEVLMDDHRIPVGGPKQKSVLAL